MFVRHRKHIYILLPQWHREIFVVMRFCINFRHSVRLSMAGLGDSCEETFQCYLPADGSSQHVSCDEKKQCSCDRGYVPTPDERSCESKLVLWIWRQFCVDETHLLQQCQILTAGHSVWYTSTEVRLVIACVLFLEANSRITIARSILRLGNNAGLAHATPATIEFT
jgi:hypothetical protein